MVEHASPLRPYPHRAPDELAAAIGRAVAGLIPDGATIQCGIGTIPESVAQALAESGRSGLRITSMLTDGGRALIESGSCVSDGPAAIVGEIVGSPDLYRWVDHNPAVHLADGLHTHSPLAAQFPNNASVVALPATTSRGRLARRPSHLPRPGHRAAGTGAVRRHRIRRGRLAVPFGGSTGRGVGRHQPPGPPRGAPRHRQGTHQDRLTGTGTGNVTNRPARHSIRRSGNRAPHPRDSAV